MKTTFKKSLITTSILAGIAGSSYSYASTVDESTFGDFSNALFSPSVLPSGTIGISGTYGNTTNSGGGVDIDFVRLIDLPTGIQTFNLVSTAEPGTMNHIFAATQDISGSFSPVAFFFLDMDQNTSFQTPADFDGILELRFDLEGSGFVTYSVELQPVPVPAAALLFASGLGALGAAKAHRKAKRRA